MYDYVIVGAGSAGCTLASRLSAQPDARVLLLEAGPPDRKREIAVPAAFVKLFGSDVDWAFRSAPEDGLDGRSIFLPRGRTLGGSSSINSMIYQRGDGADFDEWAALGNPGWGHRDLLACFRRAEDNARGPSEHHGAGGPLRVEDQRDPNPLSRAFVAAARHAGIPENPDFNGARLDGVGLTQVTQRRGRRWSAADAYLRPVRGRRNLTVRTDAHALGIVSEGRRAAGVAYAHGRERCVARASREVILAAGAVGSPHLLMLSGIGPAEHLRAHGLDVVCDLPGVGQHLTDHLVAPLHILTPRPVSLAAAESPLNFARWLLARRGPLASNVGEAAAFVRTDPALEAPDLELIFAPVLFVGEGLQPPPGHGFTIGAVALRPESRGTVSLRSPDPLQAPVIRPRYLSDADGADLRTLLAGLRLARRIARTRPFEAWAGGELGPGETVRDEEQLERWIRSTAHGLYHLCGTCRMGPDPLAVVDPQLRVHGTHGLRVADASIMPTIVRGHTNAATIAIAERAAELIRTCAAPPLPEAAASLT